MKISTVNTFSFKEFLEKTIADASRSTVVYNTYGLTSPVKRKGEFYLVPCLKIQMSVFLPTSSTVLVFDKTYNSFDRDDIYEKYKIDITNIIKRSFRLNNIVFIEDVIADGGVSWTEEIVSKIKKIEQEDL